MKIKILVLLGFILLSSSCEKDDIFTSALSEQVVEFRNGLPDELPFLSLIQQPVDGYISISHTGRLRIGGGVSDYFRCNGFVSEKIDNKPGDFGMLSIGSKEMLCKSDKNYTEIFMTGAQDLFGNNIPVSLEGSGANPSMSNNIYIPEELEVTSFPDYDATTLVDMTEGFEITWNPDVNNQNDIGILLRYDPLGEYNGRHGGVENTNHNNYIITEDDGSYIFTADDFNGFPDNMLIELDMARGNYKRVATSDGQYHIGVLTYCLNTFDFYNK